MWWLFVVSVTLCPRGSYLRLDFKGPAPSLTQVEHEKFRRQQAPTILLMFWTSAVSFSRGKFSYQSCVSQRLIRKPAHWTKHPKAGFAKFGPEFNKKMAQGKSRFFFFQKIPHNSCFKTRILDETPCWEIK